MMKREDSVGVERRSSQQRVFSVKRASERRPEIDVVRTHYITFEVHKESGFRRLTIESAFLPRAKKSLCFEAAERETAQKIGKVFAKLVACQPL